MPKRTIKRTPKTILRLPGLEYFGGHNAVHDTAANGRDAVNSENEVRRTDPKPYSGQKTVHHDNP